MSAATPGFVHLHLHTAFSLREGALTIGKLIESVNWREAIRGGAVPYAITLSLAVVGFFSVAGREPPFLKPLATVAAQQALFQWVGMVVVTLGLVWLASKYAAQLSGRTDLKLAALTLLAGLMLFSVLVAGYQLLLRNTFILARIDILNFSIHPWEPVRLALAASLVLFDVCVLWLGVLALRLALTPWRRIPGARGILLPVAAWASARKRSANARSDLSA